MRLQKILYLLVLTISTFANSQNKTFTIDQVQARSNSQEWTPTETVGEQLVLFSKCEINLSMDKKDKLTIISKTDLPDKGIIYLCNDEKSNLVTVMLIDNIKMYLYSKTKRFLINFENTSLLNLTADID